MVLVNVKSTTTCYLSSEDSLSNMSEREEPCPMKDSCTLYENSTPVVPSCNMFMFESVAFGRFYSMKYLKLKLWT